METVNLQQSVIKANTPTSSSVDISAGTEIKTSLIDEQATGKDLPSVMKTDVDVTEQRKKIEEKVSELNSFVQNIQRGIQFSVHEETGRSIITITDKDTGDEIRRFPSDQVLSISSKIAESLAVPSENGLGLLVNGKA